MQPRQALIVAASLFALSHPISADEMPGSTSGQSNGSGPCVDVRIGNDRSAYLDCLNHELQRKADQEHEAEQPVAPINAQSPSNQVGTANDAAAREKMGNAFGKSAQPQRPTPFYANPLLSPASH